MRILYVNFFPCPFLFTLRTLNYSKANAMLFERMNLLEGNFSTSYQASVAPTLLQMTLGWSLLQSQTPGAKGLVLTPAVCALSSVKFQGIALHFQDAPSSSSPALWELQHSRRGDICRVSIKQYF